MRLNLDSKTKKNFKLLQSCTKVRIIELTEKIMQLEKKQIELISSSDALHTFLEGLYQEEHRDDDISIVNPNHRELTTVTLPDSDKFSLDSEFETEYRDYHSVSDKLDTLRTTLDEFKNLDSLLSGYDIKNPDEKLRKIRTGLNVKDVNDFLNDKKHTGIFKKFANYAKKESPIALVLNFKTRANRVAERNGIANSVFYTNTNQAFYAKDVALSLNKDFKGRVINTGVKLLAGIALSATLYGAGFSHGRNYVKETQGTTEPHTTIETTVTETPDISDISEIAENPSIFTNSIQKMDSYEDACQDYFEKISDIYAYNTGESIDLSGYGQNNIGLNNSTTIFIVNNNGKTYRISAQSQAGSNLTYLRKALDATGLEYEETTSSISYIIDKNDSSHSIAIADSLGNPVHSGNVLSGKNQAYNSTYVAQGRDILVAQGRNSSSLTEAECVGAYITSDQYNIQNDELSRALGQVYDLTKFIDTTFYGSSDSYTVDLYYNKSRKFANEFDAKVNGQTISNQSIEEIASNYGDIER